MSMCYSPFLILFGIPSASLPKPNLLVARLLDLVHDLLLLALILDQSCVLSRDVDLASWLDMVQMPAACNSFGCGGMVFSRWAALEIFMVYGLFVGHLGILLTAVLDNHCVASINDCTRHQGSWIAFVKRNFWVLKSVVSGTFADLHQDPDLLYHLSNIVLLYTSAICDIRLPFVLCMAFHFECRSFSARSMIVKPSKSAVLAGAAAGATVYPGEIWSRLYLLTPGAVTRDCCFTL
ncbi:hypothetical protein RHSIM_Rhsim13G0010600 [Rhododendron simsii]|uniref:Uncharacterized protein n=1 Tax=Rhododendron simsii TaxID=118357 RepID=A0A834FZH2_RHOSS|nr:hypothetical protein RHSIM_Rhsim13G0010600 [Rhododendron simsii]